MDNSKKVLKFIATKNIIEDDNISIPISALRRILPNNTKKINNFPNLSAFTWSEKKTNKIHKQSNSDKADQFLKIDENTKKFFSIISHNIKNPFTTLLGFSEILHEDYECLNQDEIKKYLSEIRKTTHSTYKFLENVLEWIFYKSGKIEIDRQLISIKQIIDEVLIELSSEINLKEVKIETLINSKHYVFADRNSLKRIFYHLISNAIKFSNKIVKVTAIQDNNNVEISIYDNGDGISVEDIGKLFREDIDPITIGKFEKKGSGLGLILVKELVDLNYGKISVASKPGEGSIFSILLSSTQNHLRLA